MNFEQLFSVDNLFSSWLRFRRGKAKKRKVILFERHLEDNLQELSKKILIGDYKHSPYGQFEVFDAKRRTIHSAEIKDRIVHQAVYDYLVKIYEPIFIRDSFASRKRKGVDKAVSKAEFFLKNEFAWNYGRCFALKCDVRKYFENVSHALLLEILKKQIGDEKIFAVMSEIVRSFEAADGKGLPLGNLTSQIFANVYLNELDKFVKNDLKWRKYLRYNDDLLFIGADKNRLREIKETVRNYLKNNLLLDAPKDKISLRKFGWGVNFLGRIILPGAVLIKKNALKKAAKNFSFENFASYLGFLRKGETFVERRRLFGRFDNFE